MKLYVARHTQTTYNVASRLNSDPSVDVDLTDVGVQQAQALAKKLANEKFDVIYVSELPRTNQTAAFINQYHGVPVVVDKRLNDNASGFEGKLTDEYLAALRDTDDQWHAVLNDGESLANARDRANDFLQELKARPHDAVLIVTHGFIIESMYGIVNGLDLEDASAYTLPQGEFVVFDI